MIIFPAQNKPRKSPGERGNPNLPAPYPSFDPTGIDQFHAVFNLPYEPVDGSGTGTGNVAGNTNSGYSVSGREGTGIDNAFGTNLDTGFLTGLPGEENGFSTDIGSLSVVGARGQYGTLGQNIGGARGGIIGGIIDGIIGLIGTSDSSDSDNGNDGGGVGSDSGSSGGPGGDGTDGGNGGSV